MLIMYFLILFVLCLTQCESYLGLQYFGDISDETEFLTINLSKPAGTLASSATFTATESCSPKARIIAQDFYVSGTYTSGDVLGLNIDLNIFDLSVKAKSVKVGMRTQLSQGNAIAMASTTGGCATIYKGPSVSQHARKEGWNQTLPEDSRVYIGYQRERKAGSRDPNEPPTTRDYAVPDYMYAGNNFDISTALRSFSSGGTLNDSGMNATISAEMETDHDDPIIQMRGFTGRSNLWTLLLN